MLLPKFPEIDDLIIPDNLDKEKMKVFLVMYKTHCQCLVDVAISGNFEETLLDILIPNTIAEMPESLLQGIQNLGLHWKKWQENSLENMPEELLDKKLIHARTFGSSLKRHAAFLHLAQVIRPVLSSGIFMSLSQELEEMASEGKAHDWNPVQDSNLIFTPNSNLKIMKRLQCLLNACSSVEDIINWLDEIIKEVIQDSSERNVLLQSRYFVLQLVYTFSKISCVLTENCSNNFIAFHLLSSLLQEYLLLAVENNLGQDENQLINSRMKIHLKSSKIIISDCFESPSSCFLVTSKKQHHTNHNDKMKKKNWKQLCRRKGNSTCSIALTESQHCSDLMTTHQSINSVDSFHSSDQLPSCNYVLRSQNCLINYNHFPMDNSRDSQQRIPENRASSDPECLSPAETATEKNRGNCFVNSDEISTYSELLQEKEFNSAFISCTQNTFHSWNYDRGCAVKYCGHHPITAITSPLLPVYDSFNNSINDGKIHDINRIVSSGVISPNNFVLSQREKFCDNSSYSSIFPRS
ncbi:DNA-binding protein RFX6-like isoform X2 [Stegodyphus dumicola]|uniref:DNA-binding protein RFX6-like isoform X2 n=1 Tax=Stegodyphus dumicola TaxID=202533 RepID=UPI0015AF65C1|nr:DNA-binding protein RFX6-like isoform X2 [Stegodyphus dumicola]